MDGVMNECLEGKHEVGNPMVLSSWMGNKRDVVKGEWAVMALLVTNCNFWVDEASAMEVSASDS